MNRLMTDPELLLRELNHRVKNNFQIITSLMNVKKRHMDAACRSEIRFLEEHVLSMSVSFRLGYGSQQMLEISLAELVHEVLSGLRQLANLGEQHLRFVTSAVPTSIGLDHGIALALYLATVVPPYLDVAQARGASVCVSLARTADRVTLAVDGTWSDPIATDALRSRLVKGYSGQLQASIVPARGHAGQSLSFNLAQVDLLD